MDLSELPQKLIRVCRPHQFDDFGLSQFNEARALRVEGAACSVRNREHVDLDPLERPASGLRTVGFQPLKDMSFGLLKIARRPAPFAHVLPLGKHGSTVLQSEVLPSAGTVRDLPGRSRTIIEGVVVRTQRLDGAVPMRIYDVDLCPAGFVILAASRELPVSKFSDAFVFADGPTLPALEQQWIGHIAHDVRLVQNEIGLVDPDFLGGQVVEGVVENELVWRIRAPFPRPLLPAFREFADSLEDGVAHVSRQTLRERHLYWYRLADTPAPFPCHQDAGGVGGRYLCPRTLHDWWGGLLGRFGVLGGCVALPAALHV
ncbi:hypothetical protein SAMCFNEI73_pA0015 (plasmid) [Sinorhizobium americanum]|uniref:Uncharacterized protein n=1 Tax=Sinorhizobium americanum TaxID=194963 RepID=A0A1L3LSD4_9HYPH|nr:hypothetical protein SAMCFNEI73_pA0015 [Sinorhizobium americanum]